MRHKLTDARRFISTLLLLTGLIVLMMLPADSESKAPRWDHLLKANPEEAHTLLTWDNLSPHAAAQAADPQLVQFTRATFAAAEGSHSVAVTVTRAGDTSAPVTVDYRTSDGSASDRSDYTTTLGTLSFAPGETEKTFTVLLTDDGCAEGNELLHLLLANLSAGAALGPQSAAAVIIIDDDQGTSSTNPIDDARSFVRQHYHDFLNREPDDDGLRFWSAEIGSCGTDAECRQVKRINVSAAFYLSIEFQETGFLAYRLHQAAFGAGPLLPLRDFQLDAQEVGRGVVVGEHGWEQKLEQNKAAFVERFAGRQAFLDGYPVTLTAAQFVDALNQNAGGTLSPAERDELVNRLQSGQATRAQALRAVADDEDFRRREFNRAFVYMEYVGYLRRAPSDLPDTNLDGFNFWLAKLEQFGGNFIQAEMVRAFIESIEYRDRFGGCRAGGQGGVLLSGAADAPAVGAIYHLSPVASASADVVDGVILNKLDVHLAADATVGQVNAALVKVGARIVSMIRGLPALTVSVPRQANAEALRTLAETLNGQPGILLASVGQEAPPDILPPGPPGDDINRGELSHLLPTHFPAAWNARRLAEAEGGACPNGTVTVLLPDYYQIPVPYANFTAQVPNFTLLGSGSATESPTHGYDVATTLAALFDAQNPTGANPAAPCVEVRGLQVAGLSRSELTARLVESFPSSGKFVINTSLAYADVCDPRSPCTPAGMQLTDYPLSLAVNTVDWKALTNNRWADFLMVSSAGNDRNKEQASIYAGLGVADYNSERNTAATADTQFRFVRDTSLWDPSPAAAALGFPSMAATEPQAAEMQDYIRLLGVDTLGAADNVLVVGSIDNGEEVGTRSESAFSETGPDVRAVGENVFTFGGFKQGTSFSAPEVTGLASYLWLLSPDLQSQPTRVTRRAILENTRDGVLEGGSIFTDRIVDAYAAVLSLDAAGSISPANAPVRKAILDVDGDGSFTDQDLDSYLFIYLDPNGHPEEPASRDYSRHDLNGDGYTGGSKTDRFDLDRGAGTTQYGAAGYSAVTQTIEGTGVTFNEAKVTDMDVLCYYAYSGLYAGDTARRRELLDGRCRPVTVKISPDAAAVLPGGRVQFTAEVTGASNAAVTWSLPIGGGTIDQAGLFMAGTAEGVFVVTATSVADPSKADDAPVQVVKGFVRLLERTFIVRSSSRVNDLEDRKSKTDTTSGVFDDQVMTLATVPFSTVTVTMQGTARQTSALDVDAAGNLLSVSYKASAVGSYDKREAVVTFVDGASASILMLKIEVVGETITLRVTGQASSSASGTGSITTLGDGPYGLVFLTRDDSVLLNIFSRITPTNLNPSNEQSVSFEAELTPGLHTLALGAENGLGGTLSMVRAEGTADLNLTFTSVPSQP